MYFSAGLNEENYIYLVECLSRCLISIHIPTGETKIEAYLPWKYTENKIGMLLSNHNIFIYSPAIDHFCVYDCLTRQISILKLQEIVADKSGFYYSNVLIEQDDFIILPFKGKEIKRYGINGELKFKDTQWCSVIARKCGCDEISFGNIRMDSACITGNQLYFSLIYENKNYLCRYELEKEEHLCEIIYCSENIAIRGVYAYSDMVLFRRIFPNKTEIVSIALDSGKQQIINVDYPSIFEEDIYGDINHLRGSFKNEILVIEKNDLGINQQVYNFHQADNYIEKGILFNMLRNEILIPDLDSIKKYSIEKIVNELEKSCSYQEGCEKLFAGEYICEGRCKLYNLIGYFSKFLSVVKKKRNSKNKSFGEFTWKTIQ